MITKNRTSLRLSALLLTSAIVAVPASHPASAATVTDLGAVPATQAISATVWLKRQNEAGFATALQAIQDHTSPTFRHWMTPAQYASYLPPQENLQVVEAALQQAGLHVTHVAEDGASIGVTGDSAAMQRAFATPIHLMSRGGTSFAAAVATPTMAGRAGTMVGAVTGLGSSVAQPLSIRQTDPLTGVPVALPVAKTVATATSSASTSPLNPYLTDNCFGGTASQTLTAAEGQVTITGNTAVNGLFEPFPGYGVCGYDATQIVHHYGLSTASQYGLDGSGQTVGIVVAYGSPTIVADVNTYSTLETLPQLGTGNFQMLTPLGAPTSYDLDWLIETTLDVTMVHAIAPKAKIVLLVAPTNETSDLIATAQYGITHHLADTISMSFGEPENQTDGQDEAAWAQVTGEAAALGIGITVSSGDQGDNGTGTPYGAPSTPADSPYVTAVGGTALGIPTAEGTRDIGWGWKSTAPNTNRVVKSKLQVGAIEEIGAGGGESAYLPKPFWQLGLPGKGRQTPDISALADPLTGADIVFTNPTVSTTIQFVTVVGGTSVAAPVMAGMSALANQVAGRQIGQLAPLLPVLPSFAIDDILPLSTHEPLMTASLGGKTISTPDVTPAALALLPTGPLPIEQFFIMRPIFSDTIFTYGVDTSLAVTPGWDNVTGYGQPHGLPFLFSAALLAW